MLAKSRMASENGRTRNVETNSIGTTRMQERLGHAGRDERVLHVVAEALVLMPTKL